MFSVLNFLLPQHEVLPMHCAGECRQRWQKPRCFLIIRHSKTTLSADPDRYLIGDDEHGWSAEGVLILKAAVMQNASIFPKSVSPVIWMQFEMALF